MKVSRARVWFQVALHGLLAGHVLAYYILGWTAVGSLDFQDFFHSLGAGVITAAVLFAGSIYLASLIWGRLFCSWGCHFGAVQDVAAWLLRRLGWRPPLLRTRFLHWSPFLVLAFVFLRPSILRWLEDGWSFQGAGPGGVLGGAGPWERLPGGFLAVATFAACGAGALLFLGTRGFCRFVCPYGALFRLTDRVSPYRVRQLRPCGGGCTQRATPPCTTACPTAIDVHRETQERAQVTSADCIRCHLCIEACPSGLLAYRASGPEPAAAVRAGTPARERFTLRAWEEALVLATAAGTFLAVDLVWGGHFLAATLALGEGFLAVFLVRLLSSRDFAVAGVPLRSKGAWRWSGVTAACLGLATLVPIYEAALFKTHRWIGMGVFDRLGPATAPASEMLSLGPRSAEELTRAAAHLARALELFPGDRRCRRALSELYSALGDPRSISQAEEDVRRHGETRETLAHLRRVYLRFQRVTEAEWVQRRLDAFDAGGRTVSDGSAGSP